MSNKLDKSLGLTVTRLELVTLSRSASKTDVYTNSTTLPGKNQLTDKANIWEETFLTKYFNEVFSTIDTSKGEQNLSSVKEELLELEALDRKLSFCETLLSRLTSNDETEPELGSAIIEVDELEEDETRSLRFLTLRLMASAGSK